MDSLNKLLFALAFIALCALLATSVARGEPERSATKPKWGVTTEQNRNLCNTPYGGGVECDERDFMGQPCTFMWCVEADKPIGQDLLLVICPEPENT